MKGSLSQLENALNSTLVNSNVNFDGVSIDSRTIKKGNLFVAIKGENFDGHQFVNDAVKKGSAAIVTEKQFEHSRHAMSVLDNEEEYQQTHVAQLLSKVPEWSNIIK